MLPLQIQATLTLFDQIVTWEQLLTCGVTDPDIRRFVRHGDLVKLRAGAYTSAEAWQAAAEGPPREILRARAAGAVMQQAYVFSHDSAAHFLGLDFLMPTERWVHISRPGIHGSRHLLGVKQHNAIHEPEQVVAVGSARVLDSARTAMDLARQYGFTVGLSAADSAMRAGVQRSDLRAAVACMSYWRGVNSARDALQWADPGAENPGESLARIAVIATGLGTPTTQFPVRTARGTVWCDMVLGPQAIEFDGRLKYRRTDEGGVATQDPGEVVWRERSRERELIRAGLGVSRLVWADLEPRAWSRTVQRLHDEILLTVSRVGEKTPAELLEFAHQMGDERARRIHAPTKAA